MDNNKYEKNSIRLERKRMRRELLPEKIQSQTQVLNKKLLDMFEKMSYIKVIRKLYRKLTKQKKVDKEFKKLLKNLEKNIQ